MTRSKHSRISEVSVWTDDILIIPGGSRFLGDKRTPITVEEVEEIMR